MVGVVTPWNYPLLMAAWKIAPILAAGNAVVIKPSEQTPLTTMKFAELVADLLPAGVLNVVTGTGPVVGARLAEHPDIAMIALTGSVSSGRAVARGAADAEAGSPRARRQGARCHLRGRRPGRSRPRACAPPGTGTPDRSAAPLAGSWCMSRSPTGSSSSWSTQVETFVVGEPGAGDDVEIGPLVSKAHFDRVTGFLDRAREAGVRAAVGGSALDGPGFFVAPTVLVDVTDDHEVARDEIFGPVVTVETFADEAEAVRRANAVPYGLSASVWTENARRSHDVAARLDAGTVWVNSHLVLATEAPWGGFKGSGYGRDLSLYALDDYSRTKHVMHNHGR